jgi:hypothetical protein
VSIDGSAGQRQSRLAPLRGSGRLRKLIAQGSSIGGPRRAVPECEPAVKRISTSGLMSIVVLSALGFAAMQKANALWAGVALFLVIGMLGVSTLGILYRHGAKRAGWVGFTLFGGVYLVISLAPWLSTEILPRLPTTRIVELTDPAGPADLDDEIALLEKELAREELALKNTESTLLLGSMPSPAPDLALSPMPLPSGAPDLAYIPVVETARNKVEFVRAKLHGKHAQQAVMLGTLIEYRRQVGHCLFALLLGLVGALIARGFYGTREPQLVVTTG